LYAREKHRKEKGTHKNNAPVCKVHEELQCHQPASLSEGACRLEETPHAPSHTLGLSQLEWVLVLRPCPHHMPPPFFPVVLCNLTWCAQGIFEKNIIVLQGFSETSLRESGQVRRAQKSCAFEQISQSFRRLESGWMRRTRAPTKITKKSSYLLDVSRAIGKNEGQTTKGELLSDSASE